MESDASILEHRGQRTLAAIVFTDGVNFSGRMSADEEHTLNLINRDLQFMKDLCGHFDGQVVKSTGDGLLMYFISAAKAVRCALEIQRTFLHAASSLAPRDLLSHRIGIHLGDVFITDTEAMGNGVNIAARLLTEAEPGTICVSQTVYDVVRGNIPLEAIFLGRKELKNIQESIPVYLIRPVLSANTDMDIPIQLVNVSTDTETSLRAHGDRYYVANIDGNIDYQEPPRYLFDQVVQNLEHHQDLIRIKKLIFYACINRWENDQRKLERSHLKGLIQELLEIAPSLGQLKALLAEIVETINKKVEYSLIAEAIIRNLEPLYPPEQKLETPTDIRDIYTQVADDLNQNEHILRIKKLILYLCQNVWENETSTLDKLNFRDLILRLHELYPSFNQLQVGFSKIIETISKRAEYRLVANTILDRLRSLYACDLPVGTEKIAQTESSESVEQAIDYSRAIAALELFNTRLEIIKYVNPLQVKMLILAMLNPEFAVPYQDMDWRSTRNYDLDGLLRDLLLNYPNIADLENSLQNMAEQLDQPEQNAQAATAIVKALRPIYDQLHSNSN